MYIQNVFIFIFSSVEWMIVIAKDKRDKIYYIPQRFFDRFLT